MRLARLGEPGQEIPVVVIDGTALDLRPLADDIDGHFWVTDGPARVAAAVQSGALKPLKGAGDLRRGAPVSRPGKIVCVGLNYRDHAEETGAEIPSEPIVFMKDPMTLIGPDDTVLIPRRSTKTDWEVELGVVVGKQLRYAESAPAALNAVAGYAVSHDVSEREFQLERGGTWDKGKSCETFNPFGPYLVTPEEAGDPQSLGLRLWVNGEHRQDGTTANMIFPVGDLLAYLSQFMVLYPGDIVNTGTPAGVALGLPGQPYLRHGDVVELEIDGLGRARQEVISA